MVKNIKSLMSSDVLRHGEFEAARKELSALASSLKRYAVVLTDGSTYIPEGAVVDLTNKINWGEDVTAVTIREASGLTSAEIPKLEDPKIVSAFEALRDLGLYTPKELVNKLIMTSQMALNDKLLDADSTPADLRNAFGRVKTRLQRINTTNFKNRNVYVTAVRKVALVISPDEMLERATSFGEAMRVMEPAIDALDRNSWQPMNKDFIRDLISYYVNGESVDTDLAIRIMEVRCCERSYMADFSGAGPQLAICPGCGGLIDRRPDLFFCPICGREIRKVCPRCGNIEVGAKQCSRCGSDFEENERKINVSSRNISEALARGDVPTAERELRSLKAEFPHRDLGSLEGTVDTASSDYRATVAGIEDEYSRRQLYAVKRSIEKGRMRYPSLRDEGTLGDYYDEACEKVEEASSLCEKAKTQDPQDALRSYITASNVCPDYPGALRRLRDFPPEGPDGAECEVLEDRVKIKFRVPEQREGMTFCIYRGEGTLPEMAAGTVPLAEIPGGVYVDTAVSPGADYYYRIHSKRWGVLSRTYTVCGPAVVVTEVSDVTAEPLEDGLRITYAKPAGCSRVRVFRRMKGTSSEKELLGGAGVIEDRGLKGGKTYQYLFITEYDLAGRTERSYGVMKEATAPEYPKPVPELRLKWMRTENGNKATWDSELPVDLYTSSEIAPRYGDIVPVRTLEAYARKLKPDRTFEGGCIFGELPGAVNFVTAVTVVGETAVIGASQRIVNLRPFSDIRRRGDVGACLISADWPDDAVAAVLIGRDPDDPEHEFEPITVARSDYDREHVITVPTGASERIDIAMYAVYRIDGNEVRSVPKVFTAYSGNDVKIRYAVTTEKDRDRTLTRVVVHIDCPMKEDGGSIPRVVMVLAKEGIPLRSDDGEILWDSERAVNLDRGLAEVSFPVEKEKADIKRMRLFFTDHDEYWHYKLVHPLYGRRAKI